MLTLLISGPNQLGNPIDVYFQPLIDNLQILWEIVQYYDTYKKETFTLRGVLLWIVNDFPVYGNLSGYCVKGYKACLICSEGTHVIRLINCKKEAYMGHRLFSDNDHPYQRYIKSFNGEQEWGSAPKPLSGEEIYEKVSQVITQFGKKPQNNAEVRKKDKRKEKGKGREKEKGKCVKIGSRV